MPEVTFINGFAHNSQCSLCGKQRNLTFHHLIPRTCHSNKWFKKNFTKEDMLSRGIIVCQQCHTFIHKSFTEKELGRNFNSLDKLLQNDRVAKYVLWAVKQK